MGVPKAAKLKSGMLIQLYAHLLLVLILEYEKLKEEIVFCNSLLIEQQLSYQYLFTKHTGIKAVCWSIHCFWKEEKWRVSYCRCKASWGEPK